MSKRDAFAQITKDTMPEDVNSWAPTEVARPASPARLASRKIARLRGGRRPLGAGRSVPGLGATSSSLLQQQQSFPTIGQTSGSPLNSFSFGTPPVNNSQSQTSQSFPPFGVSTNNDPPNVSSTTNNLFTAPSGSFSFNSSQVNNNPFANISTTRTTPAPTNSYHGSIFNVDGAKDTTQSNTQISAKPLFPTVAPTTGQQTLTSQPASEQTKAATGGFIWPPPQQQEGQQSNNLFQSTAASADQPHIFAQSLKPSKASAANPFANIKSPQVGAGTEKTTASGSTDMFAHLKTSQAGGGADNTTTSSTKGLFTHLETSQQAQTKPAENPFAASIAKFHEDQKKKGPVNLFGNLNPPPTPSSLNLFENPSASTAQAQPSLVSTDSMKTSPDTTPHKQPASQATPFQFMKGLATESETSPTKASSILGTGKSLFDRVTHPSSESSQQPITGADRAAPNPTAASKLFGTFDKPATTLNFTTPPMISDTAETPGSAMMPTSSQTINATENGQGENFAHDSDSPMDVWPGDVPPTISYFSSEEKKQMAVSWRLRLLDLGVHNYFKHNPGVKDIQRVWRFYNLKKQAILDAGSTPIQGILGILEDDRKRSTATDANLAPQAKRSRPDSSIIGPASTPQSFSARNLPSSNLSKPDSLPFGFNNVAEKSGQISTPAKSSAPLHASFNTTNKRKADEDPPRDSASSSLDSAKRSRGPDTAPKSQTSSLFSTILDSSSRTPSHAQATSQSPDINSPLPKPTPEETNNGKFLSQFGQPTQEGSIFSSSAEPTSAVQAPTFGDAPPASFMAQFGQAANQDRGLSSSTGTQKAQPHKASDAAPTNSMSQSSQFTKKDDNPAPSTAVPAIQPPRVGNGTPVNFMTQFGEAVKNKRKVDTYDSDDDDEASWEEKDAEEERRQKLKAGEASKSAKRFKPSFESASGFGSDTTSGQTSPQKITSNLDVGSSPHVGYEKKSPPRSVFDTTHPAFNDSGHHNVFGHQAKSSAGADASKNSEVDDKDENEYEPKESSSSTTTFNPFGASSSSAKPLGRSLFDRVEKPTDAATPSKSDTAASQTSPASDHTWKVDSPIKFSASTTTPSGPTVSFTSPSPSKTPFTGLFGAPAATDTPAKPAASIFSGLPSTTPSSGLGFGFGPSELITGTLAPPSAVSSRATSPGATTADSATESAAEGTDEAAQKQSQLDLLSERPGEENEDVLCEVRARALIFDSTTKKWEGKGLGPLRVLKHRETGVRRVLLRADPSGKVAINSGIPKDMTFKKQSDKAVQCFLADLNGKVIPWVLKVKSNEEADNLLAILEESKISE